LKNNQSKNRSIYSPLKLLKDPSNASLLNQVVERFSPTGFAKDFATEVLNELNSNKI
jgi:hypothetical protein